MSLHYLGKHEPRKLCLTVGLSAFEGSVVNVNVNVNVQYLSMRESCNKELQKWVVEK